MRTYIIMINHALSRHMFGYWLMFVCLIHWFRPHKYPWCQNFHPHLPLGTGWETVMDGHGSLQRSWCPWGGALLKLKVQVMVEEALEHLGSSRCSWKNDGKIYGKWWFNIV